MHFLGRLDSQNLQTAFQHRADRRDETEPGTTQRDVVRSNKAQLRQFLASIPVRMEGAGEVMEVESDPMRLVAPGCNLQGARPIRQDADEAALAFVREKPEVRNRRVSRRRAPRSGSSSPACRRTEAVRACAYCT